MALFCLRCSPDMYDSYRCSADPETADIWLPDLTAWNAKVGLMHSFDPTMAVVSNDGVVYWSRPGTLEALCRFSGLANFPYGNLKCMIEVGGWSVGAQHMGLVAMPGAVGCADLRQGEIVSQSSYTEVHQPISIARL